MFGLPILEVAIGLSFVYLLLALICTTLNETIAGITGRRADVLEEGISSLLGDDPRTAKRCQAVLSPSLEICTGIAWIS